VQPESPAEDEQRRECSEPDSLGRSNPASIHGEDEEEDDSEHRHDSARPGEAFGSHQLAEVELAMPGPGLRLPLRTKRGGEGGQWLGLRRRRSGHRRWRRRGRGGCRGSHGAALRDAADVRELPRQLVEPAGDEVESALELRVHGLLGRLLIA
jgi:hypothetical protein